MTRTMIAIFLLCAITGVQTLDVCASCHVNATCDDKPDGSGKVCNCMYGFVGNGRTFCQDKDECQIGASKICGQHTICHNTYGSYYCTCLSGYTPSNDMGVFIPNDGTHCREVDCGQPSTEEDTVLLSKTGTTYGSVATFVCDEGFFWANGDNTSVCGADGLWTRTSMVCEEVDCGQPSTEEDTVLLSKTGTTYGSVATFVCDEGFFWANGDNTSVCGADGLWTRTSMVCEAKCGPVPFLANSEVVWHNRSVVIHRCVEGYHSWRGSSLSVCGISGVWEKATLKCIEIKPPIDHLYVFNENCVHWKAEKYEEDMEVYKVTYVGSRDYQRSFQDRRNKFLSSKAGQLELCLNLLPVTNYSISITAVSARFTAIITTNTSLPVPSAPVVHYKEFETAIPTLWLRRSANTLDPISLYQVFVLPVEKVMVFDCSSAGHQDLLNKSKSSSEYITAQILVKHIGSEMNFTVGDGFHYGGFYNAPLENGKNYYVILRAVTQWKTALKSSCILWAKVGGTSYALRVSLLSAVASVGLVALAIWGGYNCIWFFKRT
uniref:Sushi domain containing 1 n=1 Tax=Echeneis naucrates TaxID=173247 RepID=A0A665WS63_ECHNA